MLSRRNALLSSAAFAAITFCKTAKAEPSVFYVDPLGDDNKDGRSPTTAWRSVRKINSVAFPPGATVLFSKSNVWRETLKPSSDNITIGSYGNGTLPIIIGADRIEDVSAEPDIFEHSSDGSDRKLRRWSARLTTEPTQVFVDEIRGERMASPADVLGHRQWHWALNKLTVCGAERMPPLVEASTRDYAINLNDRTGLTIQDIHFARGAYHNVMADTLAQSTIQRVTITDAFVTGISASSEKRRDGVTVQDCVVMGCGCGGIGFGGQIDGWIIQRNLVKDCCQLTDSVIGTKTVSAANFQWTYGIKNWGWGQAEWQGSYAIRNNAIMDCHPVAWALKPNGGHGVGIWADEVVRPSGRPVIVYNTVARCYSRGCYLEKVDNHDLDYNLVYGCATAEFSGGIGIQANKYGFDVATNKPDNDAPRNCTNNRIRHNTVVGGWWQLEALCGDQKCVLADNIIEDNIFCPQLGKGSSAYIHGGGANDEVHGNRNLYQNNNWGADKDSARVWGTINCKTISEFQTLARGAVIESIPGDPQFTCPAADDYTLRPGSPCRGRALHAPLKLDILGNPAQHGASADVGCYESL